MKKKIKGINDIIFNNKIESQWAYIFEKLKLEWKYKPIDLDLNGYQPPFIIKFNNEEFLIEIIGDANIWKKEVYKPVIDKILNSGWKGQFGILGSLYKISNDGNKKINVGKLYQNKWDFTNMDDNDDNNIDDLLIVYSDKINKYFVDGLENKYILDSPEYDKNDIDICEYFQKLWIESKLIYKN